ncbi:MAG: hypothetical protein E7391_02180 [Ruminococcaceae bacterium]|nr:hypothetical protein [Oscillospiraceae bacterium]
MKKLLSIFLVFMIVFTLVPTTFAQENKIGVTIYGAPYQFDVMPINENGRVLVPMRAIFEKLGAKVEWDDATKTVTGTKLGKEVKLTIGDTTAYVNGSAVALDVPAKIVDNRTLVPVRFISESMGAKVDWIDETKTVVVERGETTNIACDDGRKVQDGIAKAKIDENIPDVEGANVRRPVPNEFEKSSDLNDLIFFPQPEDPEKAVAKLTGGKVLATTEDFIGGKVSGEEYATYEVVNVDGMPFDKALRFTATSIPKNSYSSCLEILPEEKFEVGDVGYLVLYTRLVSGGTNDSGEGVVEVTLQETESSGKKAAIQNTFTFNAEWKKTYIPYSVAAAVAGKSIRLHIRPSRAVQVIDVGGYELVNFGQAYTIDDMPTSMFYAGMEEDAQWRRDALDRIEKVRKGDITITVKDANGNVIPDADIKLDMYETEFEWGTAIGGSVIKNDENGDKYRQNLSKYFNGAVMESGHKWNYYENDPENANFNLDWAIRNGLTHFRSHTLVWDCSPGSSSSTVSHTPPDVYEYRDSGQIDKLKNRIKTHIYEQAGDFAGRAQEFDVINEMTRNDTWIMQTLGIEGVKEIFAWARESAPTADLYFNETNDLSEGTRAHNILVDILDKAVEAGVDFDGIGIQGHQGNPKDPTIFLNTLNFFGERYPDKKLKVTEFDVLLAGGKLDPDYQGNFVRDILIAMYSCEHLDGVYNWGMWDYNGSGRLLFDKNWSLRPAGKVFEDLVYNKWWTREEGKTDANGVFSTRGYFGDYDIVVTANGKTKSVTAKLYKDSDKNIVITMD